VDVEVTTRGPVAPENAELASEKIAGLESALRRPLRGARVVLLEEENQRIPHSARAEEEVWLEGKPIRGRVAAENMTQAINDLADRLQPQLRRHVDRPRRRDRCRLGPLPSR
jgi:ribosome-associated translation inhibitor RaiA